VLLAGGEALIEGVGEVIREERSLHGSLRKAGLPGWGRKAGVRFGDFKVTN
jgi:hypothetical protein